MHAPPAATIGEYVLGGFLGRGAYGDVREAVRASDGRRFALKMLRDVAPSSIAELKHEARTLWNLRAPGLAVPTDLGVEDGRWFVALPLIDGTDIANAASGVSPESLHQWLVGRLAQLVETLDALHQAGLLHLDIKPANVMVSSAGEVTLLDFGFSRWVSGAPSGVLRLTDEIGGTLGYMAPETLRGEEPTAACDWYSVGAVLHEVLAGRTPDVRYERTEPALGDSILENLCREFLAFDPGERAGSVRAREVLGLGPRCPAITATPFVGRERELSRLLALLDGTPNTSVQAVFVEGDPGIGKTRLLQAFQMAAESRATRVMVGRCYEHERTQYKGFEGVADELQAAGAVPASSVLFPDAAADVSGEARTDAYGRLAVHLAGVVGAGGSVLVVDDIQWLDEDGAALLAALLASPARPISMLVASTRSATSWLATRARLDERAASSVSVTRLALDPLGGEAARLLARACAPHRPDVEIAGIAASAAGSPFAIELLATASMNATRRPLSEAVTARILGLDRNERVAMELVALSAGPVAEAAIVSACAKAGSPAPNFAGLRSTAWLRSVSGTPGRVTLYHDILRAHFADALEPDVRAQRTSALLDGLVTANAGPHETFPHAAALGLSRRAAKMALAAAENAERAYAYEAAAHWYEQAHGVGGQEWSTSHQIMRRCAMSWYAAGRLDLAAPLFSREAARAEGEVREELVRLAADAMMVGGFVGEGRTSLAPWLQRYRIPGPRSRLKIALTLLRRLLLLRVPAIGRFAPDRGPSPRARMAWTLGKGLAFSDALEALDYSLLALQFALRDGDRHLAATLLAFIGGGVLHHIALLRGRGERYLATSAAIADEAQDHVLLAHTWLWGGIKALDIGDWGRAEATLGRTLTALERDRGSHWERLTARQSTLWIAWKRGDYRELRDQAAPLLADATERGDELGRAVFAQYVAFSDLAAGKLDPARRLADWLRRTWAGGRFTVQTFYATLIDVAALCLEDDRDAAWAAWREIQRDFRLAGGNRAPIVAIENLETEARLRILDGPDRHAKALRKIATRLRRLGRPASRALASWIQAALSRAGRRETEAAIGALRDAGLRSAGLALELQYGRPKAARELRERGIEAPESWAAAIYPLGRTPR